MVTKSKVMSEKELRREFCGYDVDGDLTFTIHVATVHQLLKDCVRDHSDKNETLKRHLMVMCDLVAEAMGDKSYDWQARAQSAVNRAHNLLKESGDENFKY